MVLSAITGTFQLKLSHINGYRLPFLMVAWGTMACLHATTKSYTQLLLLRFFLGVFEAGFFPGK